MRYDDDLELPDKPWSLRISAGHNLSADGEVSYADTVSARRPVGIEMPVWRQEPGKAPVETPFPDQMIPDYVHARLLPIIADFHALAARLCGSVLAAVENAAPDGLNVGMVADIEVWSGRQRPLDVDFWVELPSMQRGFPTLRLLCRHTAGADTFSRGVFVEATRLTEMDDNGAALDNPADDITWADARDVALKFRSEIYELLRELPESR